MKRIYRYMKCQFVGTWRAMFATFAIGSWQLAAIGSILLATTACTDDVNVNGGIIATDGETGITLYLPDIEGAAEFGATRVDDPVDEKTLEVGTGEAALKDMYLLAFDKSNGSRKIFPLNTGGEDNTDYKPNSSNGYKTYTIKINEGTYKFYLLANLDEYLEGKVDGLSNEDKVLEAVLKFADKVPGTLTPGKLPMACLASQMKNAPGAVEGSASEVTIVAGKNNAVYADMYFLCSKVRYTILFDQGSYSKDFTTTDVKFTDAEAINVRKETALVPTFPVEATYEDKVTGLELSGVAYPDTETGYIDGSGNLKERDEDNIPANLKPKDWSSVDGATQKAWQGTVYLPANLSSEKPTTLNFTAKGSQMHEGEPYSLPLYWKHENDSEEAHGLDRSNFYDIIIKLTTPESINKEENITVNVYQWTREALEYNLHGQYELIVDKTKIDKVQSGYWSQVYYISDTDNVYLDSPKIKVGDDFIDFFEYDIIERGNTEITDEEGNEYEFTGDWQYMIRVTVNHEIPYSVMRQLNTGGYTFTDEDGEKTVYKDDFKYFHIVAGNLHKKIEIEELEVGAYLIVDPLKINIDVRQYFNSGQDDLVYDPNDPDADPNHYLKINFRTNFDSSDETEGLQLTLYDPNNLFGGKGSYTENDESKFALKLDKIDKMEPVEGEENLYHINTATGDFFLPITGLTSGISYWQSKHEYTLVFTLSFPGGREPKVETVTITVIPFTTNYTIHFYDNTKEWDDPHIYVYQLLTLPSDLKDEPVANRNYKYSDLSGKIVGFIENNTSSGAAWNAAVQYVFTNNLSFRGWKGYGGPDINDPYGGDPEKISLTPSVYERLPIYYGINAQDQDNFTMGYVFFGDKDDRNGSFAENKYAWNYSYCYTYPDGAYYENTYREKRYNYDVNFNEDHVKSSGTMDCSVCVSMNPDFNDENSVTDGKGTKNRRFYPGISMKKEPDDENPGWYKYTLTGVAQPGRTVIAFANKHKPWNESARDYYAEDFRFPGDYEAAMPLFDYADNDGWFVFNGNTTISDQHFSDNKPTTIPHTFTSAIARNLRIEFAEYPDGFQKVEVSDQNWNNSLPFTTLQPGEDGHYYIDAGSTNWRNNTKINVKVTYNNGNTSKQYELSPKNFQQTASATGKYEMFDPLRFKFDKDIPMFVKWNDHVVLNNDSWGGDYSYYSQNKGSECNYLMLYAKTDWGKSSQIGESIMFKNTDKEISNYKHVTFKTPESNDYTDKLILRLSPDKSSGKCYQVLKVEDLPKYFNPSDGLQYYQINWHLFVKPSYTDSSYPEDFNSLGTF